MVVNDPIADMLTRIRNAQIARHDSVVIPASNIKKAIAKILLDEGYIKSVENISDGLQGSIKIGLKYLARPAGVRHLRRAAQGSGRPGHRHRFHFQGPDDRQGCPEGKHGRRSALLHLVI